jgi:hypothetical protein
MSEPHNGDKAAKAAWQSQALEAPRISLEYVRLQAEKWNAGMSREIRIEYWTAAVCAALIAIYLLIPDTALTGSLERVNALAASILLAGAIHVAVLLRHRYRAIRVSDEDNVLRLMDVYRTSLQRRQAIYRERSARLLWPIVLSACVLFCGEVIYDTSPYMVFRAVAVIVVVATGIVLGRRAAWRKADELQREIDAIVAMEKGAH